MKWKRRLKIGFAVLAAVLIAAGLWFARPLTLEAISGVEPGECVSIQFYYALDGSKGMPEEKIELLPGDEGFSALLELLQEKKFSRSPFWWIPRGGQSHRWMDGDFRWNLYLVFEDAELPDGTIGSGAVLSMDNFFEELSLRGYDGRRYPVRTSGQEQWVKDVLDAALSKIDSK